MKLSYLPKLLLGCFFVVQSTQSLAQEYPRKELNLQQFVQQLIGTPSENANYEDLFQLYINPLNLNTATREELAATYLLSEKQLNSFIQYRNTAGPLMSVYELQAIPDFDLVVIYRLLPFVKVEETIRLDFSQGRSEFILRLDQTLETKKGFTPPDSRSKTRYEGSSQRWYARYKYFHPRDFNFGFTVDKDAGETLGWNPSVGQYGFDYTSIHFQIQNKGIIKNLVLGDYQLQFGQGLIMASGFYIGKGAETILTTRRSHTGIRPYMSATEYGFLRGGAVHLQLGSLNITPFYSAISRDGNITAAGNVSSLQTSGLHRTASEIADRGSVFEKNLGLNLTYGSRNQSFKIGATILQTSFDKPLLKADKPYNLYEFKGKENFLMGLHYGYIWRNINLFGEIAHSQSGGTGMINGGVISLGKKTDVAVLHRRYERDFHSFFANAFSEGSRNINEEGLYIGIKHNPNKRLTLSVYGDMFWFPYLKFGVSAPSNGFGILAQAEYKPDKKTRLWVQLRQENKDDDLPDTKPVIVATVARRNFLIQFDKTLPNKLYLQSRFTWGSSTQQPLPNSTGFAIMQDIEYDFERFSLSGRVAYFNTDNYDTRQYAYENDVLYAFSFPAYYGKGVRHYLVARYKIKKGLDCWVRWARTDYWNQETIGSGLDEITGSHRSDIRMQLRWSF
jgi:hypothetical protein